MTFDDDFCQFEFDNATRRVYCKSLGIEWPPPEVIDFMGFKMKLISHSQITDEQREGMSHIMRGAIYRPQSPSHLPIDEGII